LEKIFELLLHAPLERNAARESDATKSVILNEVEFDRMNTFR
jgi:hypothetical protein